MSEDDKYSILLSLFLLLNMIFCILKYNSREYENFLFVKAIKRFINYLLEKIPHHPLLLYTTPCFYNYKTDLVITQVVKLY